MLIVHEHILSEDGRALGMAQDVEVGFPIIILFNEAEGVVDVEHNAVLPN